MIPGEKAANAADADILARFALWRAAASIGPRSAIAVFVPVKIAPTLLLNRPPRVLYSLIRNPELTIEARQCKCWRRAGVRHG